MEVSARSTDGTQSTLRIILLSDVKLSFGLSRTPCDGSQGMISLWSDDISQGRPWVGLICILTTGSVALVTTQLLMVFSSHGYVEEHEGSPVESWRGDWEMRTSGRHLTREYNSNSLTERGERAIPLCLTGCWFGLLGCREGRHNRRPGRYLGEARSAAMKKLRSKASQLYLSFQ